MLKRRGGKHADVAVLETQGKVACAAEEAHGGKHAGAAGAGGTAHGGVQCGRRHKSGPWRQAC
eukprot:4359077-Prorocentrum_lima.AAC.1